MVENYNVSVNRACRCVLLARSMYYYCANKRDDTLLRLRINEIAKTRVRYGFWRIYILLKREGFTDNHKRVYRIYKEEGLNLRSKRPRRNRAGAHRLERVENSSLNKVWSMDFVQDSLFNGSQFIILAIVDNFSKKCLGLVVGKSLKGSNVVEQLEQIRLIENGVAELCRVVFGKISRESSTYLLLPPMVAWGWDSETYAVGNWKEFENVSPVLHQDTSRIFLQTPFICVLIFLLPGQSCAEIYE